MFIVAWYSEMNLPEKRQLYTTKSFVQSKDIEVWQAQGERVKPVIEAKGRVNMKRCFFLFKIDH